jgi:hypothetical protein
MDTERSSDHELVFSLLAAASGIEKRLDKDGTTAERQTPNN